MSYLENIAQILKDTDGEVNLSGLVWNNVVSPSLHDLEHLKTVIGKAIAREYLIAQCVWCKLYYKLDTMSTFRDEIYSMDFAECKDCKSKKKKTVILSQAVRNHWKMKYGGEA